MKLSVIIVNYQVKFYLAQCIHSVVKSMNGIDGEIIVVDNDSKDNSIEFLRNLYPEVRYIENKENGVISFKITILDMKQSDCLMAIMFYYLIRIQL